MDGGTEKELQENGRAFDRGVSQRLSKAIDQEQQCVCLVGIVQ